MALPKVAQQQLEKAEALHKQVYEGEVSPDDKVTPISEGEEIVNEPKSEDAAAAPKGSQPPAGEEPSVEAPTGDRENDPEYWKQKYKVLQGKYDAEIPRLQQDNQSLQGRLGEMETQMSQITAQMAAPGSGDSSAESKQYLNPDEIEDYGEDMIDVVKRAAREEFEPQLNKLHTENEQLRNLLGGMQQATAMSARDQMLASLDEQLTNWRELNGTPEFLAWLENVDVYSGQKKLDMLRQAFENNNTARVLAFFKGFLNENAAMAPSTAPSEPTEPTVGLETLVAPGSAKDGGDSRAQEGAPNGPTWTQATIREFYRDVNRGVYREKPEERERLERDIFLAQQEGRIAP